MTVPLGRFNPISWVFLLISFFLFSWSSIASPALATTITASRSLPQVIPSPGTLAVTLSVHIDGAIPNGIIVKEYLPPGWQVASAVPGFGAFDPVTGLVEWVLFGGSITADTGISYQLQVPSGLDGTQTLQGYVLFNDANGDQQTVSVGGAAALSVYTQQVSVTRSLPATYDAPSYLDVSLSIGIQGTVPNGLIVLENLPPGVQFVSANPVQTSIDAATGVLKWVLAGGEVYPRPMTYRIAVPSGISSTLIFSGSAKFNDPLSNQVSVATGGDNNSGFSGTAQSITGTRELPGNIIAGQSSPVTIGLQILGPAPNGLILKEFVPVGWAVTNAAPAYAAFNPSTGEVQWLFNGAEVKTRDVVYTISPPGSESGESVFSGQILFNDASGNPQTVPLSGNASVAVNRPPVASAGQAQSVGEGAVVTLDGSGSVDPDGGITGYLWVQEGGAAVVLSNTGVAQPTFTAPEVSASGESLVFRLTVTDDDGAQSSDTVPITVSSTFLPGDLNYDSKTDIADAIIALQAASGIAGSGGLTGADVNNDARIGIAEVLYILQKVSGLRGE